MRDEQTADSSFLSFTQIVLVGGMTRMPKVVEIAKDIFKKEPFKVCIARLE